MASEEKNIDLERDLSLIKAYKERDDVEALGHFFNNYMPLIYGVCLKYLKDVELSKDTVMDIYEKLSKKLKKHDVANPKSWLYILTKNHCYEILRKKSRTLEKENSAYLMYSEQVYHLYNEDVKEQKLSLLEECIGKLESMQQSVVRMFYLDKKTYKEICSEMSIKWDKARSLIQNGRRNLKICMETKYEAIEKK